MNTCTIIEEDSRKALKAYQGQADLIFTSPLYADVRKKNYTYYRENERPLHKDVNSLILLHFIVSKDSMNGGYARALLIIFGFF